MNHIDRLIVDCPSFEEFRKRTSALPLPKDRGDTFERLTQVYLQTAPEYRTSLSDVWLPRDVPALRQLAVKGIQPELQRIAARCGTDTPAFVVECRNSVE